LVRLKAATGRFLKSELLEKSILSQTTFLKSWTCSQGKYDFNDLLFAQICRTKNMVFVTHDKDFSELGVEILTANEKLMGKGKG
jgi:predicted nuclease of predicted toxin-antitoxin system